MTLPENSFFFKDVFDRGCSIARQEPIEPIINSMGIIRAYTMLDDAYDENGAPKYDYLIWAAIARLMITAGDVACASVIAHPEGTFTDNVHEHYGQWHFYYALDDSLGGKRTFLTLNAYKAPVGMGLPDMPMRDMGSVEREAYVYKLGAYPKMVHPRLPERAIANLHFVLIQYLTQAGLQVVQHWIPEDSSQGFARYLLSDGLTTYVLEYHAPELLEALIKIDAAGGRSEADGALVSDPTVTEFQTVDPAPAPHDTNLSHASIDSGDESTSSPRLNDKFKPAARQAMDDADDSFLKDFDVAMDAVEEDDEEKV